MSLRRALPILAALSVLGACAPARAQTVALVGQPALAVAVIEDSPRCAADYVVVTVTAFSPAADGRPVQLVFALVGPRGETELGRPSIFPHAPFSEAAHDPAQRFGFRIDRTAVGDGPFKVRMSLDPISGGGAGASASLGQVHLKAAPGEGC